MRFQHWKVPPLWITKLPNKLIPRETNAYALCNFLIVLQREKNSPSISYLYEWNKVLKRVHRSGMPNKPKWASLIYSQCNVCQLINNLLGDKYQSARLWEDRAHENQILNPLISTLSFVIFVTSKEIWQLQWQYSCRMTQKLKLVYAWCAVVFHCSLLLEIALLSSILNVTNLVLFLKLIFLFR